MSQPWTAEMCLAQTAREVGSRAGLAADMLDVLHERLLGESSGRVDLVTRHLTDDFEFIRVAANGSTVLTDRGAFLQMVADHLDGGRRSWVKWDAIAVEAERITGFGALFAQSANGVEARRFGIEIRYRGLLQSRETLFEFGGFDA